MGTQSDGNRTVDPQNGMSLRDWFAGMALQGIIACPGTTARGDGTFMTPAEFRARAAATSYLYADAMLAVRNNS